MMDDEDKKSNPICVVGYIKAPTKSHKHRYYIIVRDKDGNEYINERKKSK